MKSSTSAGGVEPEGGVFVLRSGGEERIGGGEEDGCGDGAGGDGQEVGGGADVVAEAEFVVDALDAKADAVAVVVGLGGVGFNLFRCIYT